MYVCICKGITDSQIRAAVEDGATSLCELRNTLGVASRCGQCNILANKIIRQTRRDTVRDTVRDTASEPPLCATSQAIPLARTGLR